VHARREQIAVLALANAEFRLDRYFAERKSGFSVQQVHALARVSGELTDGQAVKVLAPAAR